MTASLRFKLSLWLALAIVLTAGLAGSYSFVAALDDAHAAQDIQLRRTAYLISRLDAVPASPLAPEQAGDADFDARVVVRFLRTASGAPAPGPLRPPVLSDALSDGLQTVTLGKEQWRVYVKTSKQGVRVAVAQQTTVRDVLAQALALRTVMPFLFLAPLLVLLVALLVRQMFKPLEKLSLELGRRPEHDLGQLDGTGLPSEVWPFVAEINELLTRMGNTLAAQRRFIADAAHELRSPLTAMSLQAERLGAADMPQEARTRLEALIAGLRRTRVLLDQLLTLARTQEANAAAPGAVSLDTAIREVLEDLMPLAEAKQIDLGVVGDADVQVRASLVDLKVLVKNLIDNAIRYTPEGGHVDISVDSADGAVILQIDDSGPGIAWNERERVFAPFYRVLGSGELGSGLGLAIARAVALRIGASIDIGDAGPSGSGLRARVLFGAESRP